MGGGGTDDREGVGRKKRERERKGHRRGKGFRVFVRGLNEAILKRGGLGFS